MPRTQNARGEIAEGHDAPASGAVKRARVRLPSTAQLLAEVREGQAALLRELHAVETRMQVIETRLTTIASNDNHEARSAPPMTLHPLPSFGPFPSPTRNTLPFIEALPTVAPQAMPVPPVDMPAAPQRARGEPEPEPAPSMLPASMAPASMTADAMSPAPMFPDEPGDASVIVDPRHAPTTPPPEGFVPVPPEAFLPVPTEGFVPAPEGFTSTPAEAFVTDAEPSHAAASVPGSGPQRPQAPTVADSADEEEWFANPPVPAGPSRAARFAMHAVVTLVCTLVGARLGGWTPWIHAPAAASHADADAGAHAPATPHHAEHAARPDAGAHPDDDEASEHGDATEGVGHGGGVEAPRTVRTVDPQRPAMSAREIVEAAFPTPAERAARNAHAPAHAAPTTPAHAAPTPAHAAPTTSAHAAPTPAHAAPVHAAH